MGPISEHEGGRDVVALRDALAKFAVSRNWPKYHSPKNLSMALAVEASELMRHFQWLQTGEKHELSEKTIEEVGLEIADVQIYLVILADVLGIDLLDAAWKKIAINEARFPAA